MSAPPPKRRTRRGSVTSWRRVLLALAVTWVGVMLAIYWIIRTAKW